MIQRIQSVYLLLTSIFSTIFFFIPISYISINENTFLIKASGVYYKDGDNFVFDDPLMALSTIILFHIILNIITIFQFKKRALQITLCNLNLLILFIGMGLVFFYARELPEKAIDGSIATINYSLGGLIPIVSFVLLFLSRRSIIKDDKLVRSSDRLR